MASSRREWQSIRRPLPIAFVADNSGYAVSIVKAGPGVDPIPTIGHHVRCVSVALYLRCGSVFVAHQHAVRRQIGGGFESDLPRWGIGSEESDVYILAKRSLGRIEHFFRPVLIISNRKEGSVIDQSASV